MNDCINRVFVEKKSGFDVEATHLKNDIILSLGISGIENLKIINRYDISGISKEEYLICKNVVLAEPTVDVCYDEEYEQSGNERIFAAQYLPGQYDQRADSAAQCIQIITQKEKPIVRYAKLIVIYGNICDKDFEKIKKYCINPVDSQETTLNKPLTLNMELYIPSTVETVELVSKTESELKNFLDTENLAMSFQDLKFCQKYFKNTEKRNPTITEIKVIDTYWSDHCRHTTFMTQVEDVEIQDGIYNEPIKTAYKDYLNARKFVYGDKKKDICLMDIAVIAMKEMKKKGSLNDLDESDEINACSIVVPVKVDEHTEEYLVMFKNETHNHPTEIEPFGGAATCLGGAIRDPLSGRAYVYQAMRVTGSADPRCKIEDTLKGKLPQKKISLVAAQGYSSYGNQIGLATGHVSEIYDEGYVAKRMEIGAVIGAVPRKNVRRETPCVGDVVLLVGGRTGRDGCGGATGSSKEHNEKSILTCGSEVQKGNAPTERKIQRLFRKYDVARMIKRCNDFGAGGVSVAVGELTEGLIIELDKVPKKYDGLDGTELAISESQERMAVVVSKEDVDSFIDEARKENLEATIIANVTDDNRLKMVWNNQTIVDISRDFLNTNGVKQKTSVKINLPKGVVPFDNETLPIDEKSLREIWLKNLSDLNVCCQKGLVERFDSTVGAGTILMPFGGKHQMTPMDVMAAKIPVLNGKSDTGTLMSFGYNPKISKWSPFHGAVYSVVESVSKIVAAGGEYKNIRLTLQEYFEKLGEDPIRWGKPFGALLGAYYAQENLGISAIGGKDSMSGTFNDIDVPPTVVSFAVDVADSNDIISSEFKMPNSKVLFLKTKKEDNGMPNFDNLKHNFEFVTELIKNKCVNSAYSIKYGGISAAISKMCFGNRIGFKFSDLNEIAISVNDLFVADYGSFILEIEPSHNKIVDELIEREDCFVLGHTTKEEYISIYNIEITLKDAEYSWLIPLQSIFPINVESDRNDEVNIELKQMRNTKSPCIKIAKPRIMIPVFPGTNCEFDTAKAFEEAGGVSNIKVIRNLSANDIDYSIDMISKEIDNSQIIMLPGGFSAGDEPDGSGKFIAAFFRNSRIRESVMNLLKNRDGLILGICNGFQALIKLGLVPYGEIIDLDETCPTLTYNSIGRHVSRMANTKVVSTLSPWLSNVNVGDVFSIPLSHGEGRFYASETLVKELMKNGQISTVYVDNEGKPTYDSNFNPNGSVYSVEGICSIDGRIFGKMAHSERKGKNVVKNVPGNKDQKIFEAGIDYFK